MSAPDDDGLIVRSADEPAAPPEPKWKSWLTNVLMVVGAPLLLWLGIGWLRAPELPVQAPEFRLTTLTGSEVALADLKSQTVVLNFWATWCGPCRIEMPTLVDFAADHPDIPVLYIAVDGQPDALTAFAKDQGLPLDHVLIADRATKAAYGVETLPTTVVVEPGGTVGGAHAGIILRPQLWWMTR